MVLVGLLVRYHVGVTLCRLSRKKRLQNLKVVVNSKFVQNEENIDRGGG